MVDINVSGQSLHAKSYTTDFMLEIQQTQSKLENYITKSTYASNAEKKQVIVRYGEVEMSEITGNSDNITYEELSSAQRWVQGKAYDVTLSYNEYTQGPLTEQRIRDAIVMAQMAAVKRKTDEVILASLFTSALSGTDGTSTTSYTSGNTIAADVGASANTGLNIAKWEALKEKMEQNELDKEALAEQGGAVAILTQKSHTDLRKMVETFNDDYKASYGVVRDPAGNISKFYGFDIVSFSTERLAKFDNINARLLNGSLRRIPVFTKKAIELCKWNVDIVEARENNNKRGKVTDFYAAVNLGATRVDEKLVYDIQVTE
jgi:uncharacterized protein YbaA (DUF1428 family)